MSRPAGKSNHLVGREERRGTGFGKYIPNACSRSRTLSIGFSGTGASYRGKVSKCSMIDFEQRKFRKSTRAPIVNRNLILTSIESPNRIHSLFFLNFSPRFGVRVAFEVFHGGATPRKGEEGKRAVPESGGRGKRRREGGEET